MSSAAPATTTAQEAVARYLADFELFERGQQGSLWLSKLRRNNLARFATLGIPTRRHEEWKYLDPSEAAAVVLNTPQGTPAVQATHVTADQLPLGHIAGHRLVWLNGHYAPELSSRVEELPDGVEATCLCRALANHSEVVQEHLGRYANADDEAFTALNTAFAADGAFIRVPAGRTVAEPIVLLFLSTPEAPAVSHPRNLFLVGPGSALTIIEAYVALGEGTYFTNGVTEISVGQNAQLQHIKVQDESPNAFHIGTQQLLAARASVVHSYSLNFGGKVVRNNSGAVMGDENVVVTLNGLVAANGDQLVDNHTVMDHAKPHCNSHELYAHVLDGSSNGVFNGKIFVREDAQKTDAKQSNRSLLLSRDAQVNAKPQLEIFADDVKCTHGATIGQLDQEALFYLQARGVPRDQARHILVHAFAAEVWESITVEDLKTELDALLLAKLGQ